MKTNHEIKDWILLTPIVGMFIMLIIGIRNKTMYKPLTNSWAVIIIGLIIQASVFSIVILYVLELTR